MPQYYSGVCRFCNQSFQHKTSKLFCSGECYRKERKARTVRKCWLCKITFYKKSQGHHGSPTYCSNKCQGASKKKRKIFACKQCGVQFEIKKSQAKRYAGSGNFCTKKCHDQSLITLVSLNCKHCQKGFTVKANRKLTALFCSRRCKNHHKGETYIERMVRIALDSLAIPYLQEHPIGKGVGSGGRAFSVDFYLPNVKIALEVDGDYWHKNREAHDKNRDAYIASKGIHTIRIKESELKTESACSLIFTKLLRGS